MWSRGCSANSSPMAGGTAEIHFPLEDGDGRPSRWNTLRAQRVLNWYGQSES